VLIDSELKVLICGNRETFGALISRYVRFVMKDWCLA
jgi:hypothetical protein